LKLDVDASPLTLLSEEEQLFRNSVRQFADEQVRPLVAKMDRESRMEASLIRQLFELGLMGVGVPETLGGSGGSFFMAVQAVEELSRVDASVGVLVDVQNTLVNNALLRWGTEEQQKSFLPRLCSESVGAYALSEAGSGSDAFALATRADERKDGFVPRAGSCDHHRGRLIFVGSPPPNRELGHRGITAFRLTGKRRGSPSGKEDKLGIRASSTCELTLTNALLSEPSPG
jgi:butyryl-CoA dehydrogenase/short/branched chain acyl-CoA dehydrogenase